MRWYNHLHNLRFQIHYYKISSNTLHRIKQGKPITTTTLDTLCSILACNVSGIINYIPGNAKGTNSPEKEERSIGVWGQRHLRYIREHKKALYTSLLTSGKLQSLSLIHIFRGINVKGGAKFSRKEIDSLTEIAKTYRAKGMAWLKNNGGEISSSFEMCIRDSIQSACTYITSVFWSYNNICQSRIRRFFC